jgi:hypothetical protein
MILSLSYTAENQENNAETTLNTISASRDLNQLSPNTILE